MSRKEPPPSFAAMCGGLHQDALVLLGGTLEEQADDCVGFVPPDQRASLHAYLSELLERRDSGELRRLLRKQERVDVMMPREAWWQLFTLIRARLTD